MTNAEYRDSCLADCKMSAMDCKEAADYAAYNFDKRNESEARRYVGMLEERVSRLKAELSSLAYANKKIAEAKPTTFQENDCSGVFDGNGVISDADPGL